VRLATDTERLVVIGRTGTGKTTEALSELSQRSFDEMPWIMFDFKHYDLVSQIPVNGILSLHDKPPDDPGLWTIKVFPAECDPHGPLDQYLSRVIEHRDIGLFVDEGHLIKPGNKGLREVITLGRSAHVPLIFAMQRPVFVDTFVISESEIVHLFLLQHPDDYDRIARLIDPAKFNNLTLRGLPPHHSYRYEYARDEGELLPPCPPFEDIRDRILTRLPVYEYPGGPPKWLPERRLRV
jgi:hypothetical protein